ncbi:Gamma-tubulin complex component 4 [Linnemannia exigua]|uniref:Spindle pole body component n=1 Tax=Linnemannia exigua TaxID=604196 RepID=A0AAD4H7N5_9FUNG|nr:Gamma-tubulin complex component 4 [Linnemannia exigua]
MLHELLITLSGYPGDIFRPFPQEPEIATTFAITDFPLLHPAEKEGLNRLAQLGFYFKEFNTFITSSRSFSQQRRRQPSPNGEADSLPAPPGLYLRAMANALDRKLQSYRQVIVQTEAAILSGDDNLGGIVPLSTISGRFAPFQLVFPAIAILLSDIKSAALTEVPYTGGRLINLLQDRSASGVPIQKEWMTEMLQGCCAVMLRQITSWVIYGQIQDPFGEFFIVQQLESSHGVGETGLGSRYSMGGIGHSRVATFTGQVTMSHLAGLASSAASSSSNKWQTGYSLDEHMIPTMIPTTLAHAMLFIGKSIATVQQAKLKPIPIPQSITQRHLDLLLPLVSTSSGRQEIMSISDEVLNLNLLTTVIHQIRKDIANHLWVVVQVGEKVVKTLESFKRYFLLCDGEFGLGLITSLEEFKRNRLSRMGQFITTSSSSVTIRDHDLGGLLKKAAHDTSAQDDEALASFEFRIVKSAQKQTEPEQDLFLTAEDIDQYSDVFAFLMTIRKAQVRLQQAWIEIKSLTQRLTNRRRGGDARSYGRRIRGTEADERNAEQEAEMLKHIAAFRSNMVFVVDCLWTYIQMDVIGPTYDSLLENIATHESDRKSRFAQAPTSATATPQSFDSIHSSHAEALYEIRRACLLTSTSLSSSIKNILLRMEAFCGIIGRRAAGQDGFQAGLGEELDDNMWQDWTDIIRLNQSFREDTEKLFTDLSTASKSGSLGDGPVLKRSVSGLGSSLLGNGPQSFDVIRQVDRLLLRLEYSKSKWFSGPSPLLPEGE